MTFGENKCIGFYATRYVRGIDFEEASKIAIDSVQNELQLNSNVLNSKENPVIVVVEEIFKLPYFKKQLSPGVGFTFYLENDA
ncbi:hypothetical protein [Duganella aceris]|nr:hypothetical protein [Duganella aceris]